MFSSLDENVEIVVDESRAGGMSGRFKWNVIVLMIESSIDLTAVRAQQTAIDRYKQN